MQTQIFGFDIQKTFEYENGFYITSHPSRLAKSIAHYELYKKIVELPGDIVECGVFKGASLIRFATYREMLESEQSRKIWGFDAFGEFPKNVSRIEDSEFIEKFEKDAGDGISVDELNKVFDKKGISNVKLVKGNILETLPEFAKNHAQKIALLHIDVDVYEATYAVLENLYDKVVRGGIIVFDDYAAVHGATSAVDDFCSKISEKLREYSIKKLPFNYIPCYMEKK